ncbi:hypothetical protein [Microbacterium sp. ZXX196]|uniref:hypothetical protein n=1 Tax=Microbacterium sp. ZXX196 TaxID=2609291 RepID=UPI0012B741B0|nr:hypothetical protein [Microbacterium sp. ZXX196]MTE23213.1 hypothetical protein [Microbacterium sp. ZXX196]
MSLIVVESGAADELHPADGWGDVPAADRPLWSRYLADHLPWFPGVSAMARLVPGVTNGGTRAPQLWKDTARSLHAAGFTPADYYLLAELLGSRIDALDVTRHAPLFELWPTDGDRRPRTFRLNARRWTPWLEAVRAGESPRRALERILFAQGPQSV